MKNRPTPKYPVRSVYGSTSGVRCVLSGLKKIVKRGVADFSDWISVTAMLLDALHMCESPCGGRMSVVIEAGPSGSGGKMSKDTLPAI